MTSKANTGHFGDSGVQGHSAGGYFPVTIKTIGDPEPFCHVALYGGFESGRFDSFTECERFAFEVKKLIDAGDDEAAKLLINISEGGHLS